MGIKTGGVIVLSVPIPQVARQRMQAAETPPVTTAAREAAERFRVRRKLVEFQGNGALISSAVLLQTGQCPGRNDAVIVYFSLIDLTANI